jgi:hypothetical protein
MKKREKTNYPVRQLGNTTADLSQCVLSSSDAAEVRAGGGRGKLTIFSECERRWPLSVVPGDGTGVWGKYI